MDPSSGKFIALSVGVSVITSGLIWLMIKNMERKPFPPDTDMGRQYSNDRSSSYESINPSGHINDNPTGGKKLNKKVSKKRRHTKKEKTLRRKKL
jgi:hypothetical protein